MQSILIVEDELLIGLDIAQKLEQLGYIITDTALNPDGALASISKQKPDLILMDINLKSCINGIELSHKIRDSHSIPVVYLTSYSNKGIIDEAITTDPYGYIIKPYTNASLNSVLKTAFKRVDNEKKIENQKNRLDNIMNNISDAIALISNDGIINIANNCFKDLIGNENPESRHISEILDGQISFDTINRLYKENRKEMFSFHQGETLKHFLISVNGMTDSDGERLLTITDFTDMYNMKSALFNAENRFTTIFREKQIAGVMVTIPDILIHEFNNSFCRIFNVNKEIKNLALDKIVGEEVFNKLRGPIADGQDFQLNSIKIEKEHSGQFFVNVTGKKINFGEDVFYLIDFFDITEQVNVTEMEKKLQQKLIHTNKMTSLGTLVSGVAHEINNPNNFIMFNSSLIKEFFDDIFNYIDELEAGKNGSSLDMPQMKQDVENLVSGITNGSERIRDIVQDLKGFSRSNNIDGFEEIHVVNALKTSIRILDHQISSTTENFVLNIVDPVPAIYGNYQKLEQVFINILMNAVESLSSRNKQIYVSCMQYSQTVIITIKDEGIGIATGILERVTEPFYTTKQANGGTGLGLSIAYNIIAEHKGTLELESEHGKGTTVTIKLPIINKDAK